MAWFENVSSFFHRKRSAGGDYILALDIGTSSVKAAIFHFTDGDAHRGSIRAAGFGSAQFAQGVMRGGTIQDLDAVTRMCEEAILRSERMVGRRVRDAIVGVEGGMARGITMTVNHPREDPEKKITLPEVRNMIQRTQWKALESIKKSLTDELGGQERDARILAGAVEDIQIDGYRVANPIGFDGKALQLRLFNVYAREQDARMLESIAEALHLSLHSITAGSYAVARSYAFGEDERFGGIFVDIGGEATDIALMRHGEFEGIRSAPVGGTVFTQRIAEELGISYEEAGELQQEYSSGGRLSAAVSRRIGKALERDIAFWLQGVELAIREFSQVDLFPPLFLLLGGGSKLRGIGKAIAHSGWLASLPFAETPEVHLISINDFPFIEDQTGMIRGPETMTVLGLVASFLRLGKHDEAIERAIAQSLRLLR